MVDITVIPSPSPEEEFKVPGTAIEELKSSGSSLKKLEAKYIANISALEKANQALKVQNDDLRNEVDRQSNFVQEILSSSSWRVTVPLRYIGRSFPAIRTPVRRMVKLIKWTLTFQLIGKLRDYFHRRREQRQLAASGLLDTRGTGFGWYGGRPLTEADITPFFVPHSRWEYEAGTNKIIKRYGDDTQCNELTPLYDKLNCSVHARKLLERARPSQSVKEGNSNSFSIITPFYKHISFFELCIKSVSELIVTTLKDQKDISIEWIIVNDDVNYDVNALLAYIPEEMRPYTRIIGDTTNKGISYRLNEGIDAAKGEWVLFLDCDDEIGADALLVIKHYGEKFKTCRYISSNITDIDETGTVLRHRYHTTSSVLLFEMGMNAGHLKAIRKDLFSDIGKFKPAFSGVQDYDFALRTASNEPILQIPEHLYRYRWHGSSQSVANRNRQYRRARAVRSAFLRKEFAAPPAVPVSKEPWPEKPRGLCIIRTQGKREDYLNIAIQSVLDQDPKITPCVVVHGDTVAFANVKEMLAQFGDQIVILHAPEVHLCRGAPCNTALDYLEKHKDIYHFVCFLDDDDVLLLNFARTLVTAATLTDSDVAIGLTNAVDENGKRNRLYDIWPIVALCHGNFIPINSYIVRTSAIIAAGVRFDEEIHYLEDWDFLLSLVEAGMRFAPVHNVVSEFSTHLSDGNAPVKQNKELFSKCARKVSRRALGIAKKLPSGVFWRDVLDFPEEQTVWYVDRPDIISGLKAYLKLHRVSDV